MAQPGSVIPSDYGNSIGYLERNTRRTFRPPRNSRDQQHGRPPALKDQGIASDEKLSTYLDQAGKASNVKWRAARMRMEYLLTPIQKETAGSDKSKQPEPKESQPPEAAHKLEEEQPNNQAKDNAKEKEQKEAPTKSASKDVAEKSGDPKRDASNGAPKNNQRTSSKQTA
jgi:hypothetical protein